MNPFVVPYDAAADGAHMNTSSLHYHVKTASMRPCELRTLTLTTFKAVDARGRSRCSESASGNDTARRARRIFVISR